MKIMNKKKILNTMEGKTIKTFIGYKPFPLASGSTQRN